MGDIGLPMPGSCQSILQKPSRAATTAAMDESLAQKLIEGRPFILLDNLRGRMDSPYLEAMLTATAPIPVRVPHRGEIQIDPGNFLFYATSNGVGMTKDLANRSNIVRLKKRRGHKFRTYPEGDLLEHVRANRGKFLGAVFTLVAEYVGAQKPRTADLRGQGKFRHWWQSMDWVVQDLLGEAPALDGHDAAQHRTANPFLSWLREICLLVESEGRMADDFSATGLAEISTEHGVPIPGVRDDSNGGAKVVGRGMAQLFRGTENPSIDRFVVERFERAEETPCGKSKPMKFYRIIIQGETQNHGNQD